MKTTETRDLTSPARLEGETFEEYKERRTRLNQVTKLYKKYGQEGIDHALAVIEYLEKMEDDKRNLTSPMDGQPEMGFAKATTLPSDTGLPSTESAS